MDLDETVKQRSNDGVGPLRVLHCVAHLGVGGIASILLRTLPAFDARRIEPFVCHLNPRIEHSKVWEQAGIQPVCLDHRRTVHGLRTLLRLIRLVVRLDIQLIHTHHPLDRLYGGLAAQICNLPHVTTFHNTKGPKEGTSRGLRMFGATGRVGESMLRRTVSRYLAVSKAVRRAQSREREIPVEEIGVVYHGLDLGEGQRTASADQGVTLRELGLSASQPILLNVARLHPQKGQKHLIPTMTQVLQHSPETVLLIAGEGEERANLEKRIRAASLSDHIRLLGRRDDVQRLLALADVFIFPSVQDEGLPIAVVEACFAGKPVVAASTDPLEEVVADGVNGVLVPPGQPGTMAEAILRLLHDEKLRNRLGEAGQRIAKRKFSLGSTVGKLSKIYAEVVRERSSDL